MGYRYPDGLTVADVAFQAWGKTLEELFAASWEAELAVMIPDPSSLQEKATREILLEQDSAELLLFNFLQELLFYKDAESLLLRLKGLRIEEQGGRLLLRARAAGEEADPARHRLGVDVKAVTLHHFAVQDTGGEWRATVILDV